MKYLKLALIAAVAGCVPHAASNAGPAADQSTPDAQIAAARTALGSGYLTPQTVPDPLAYLPPPPAAGSAAMARDEEASAAALALRGSPRWDQARRDAELIDPSATALFSCAAGIDIGPDTTPAIHNLLRKSLADFGLSGRAAKQHYARPRPFMINNQPICTPDWADRLRQDGSYPSGHSAAGYGWGLLLAEVIPSRAAALVARGRAYGDSRRVCNVHWLSDVEEGRITATAVFARLHAEPAFRADVETARIEAEKLQSGNQTKPDCSAENAALGTIH